MTIKSSLGSYEVEFPNSTSDYEFKKIDKRSNYVLVADNAVWQSHGMKYPQWKDFPKYFVEATEETKTLEEVNKLGSWLIENSCSKTTTILAFGGGVVQDLVTFTARIFHRGCSWEYHPTTLLSQADSCIGSKCGINIMPHKNQLGCIYAPARVVINQELLRTLPNEELVSGLGEIIKLAITGPGEFYSELKVTLEKSYPNFPSAEEIGNLTYLSLVAKKYIIEEDEHENGPRRILNYGHSFGHALETLSKNEISHGRAIVFGMDLINYLGVKWGVTREEFYLEFRELLKRYFGDSKMPKEICASSLVNQLRTDKKMAFGIMHFAVPHKAGDIRIIQRELDNNLESLVETYLEKANVFASN